VEFHANPLLLHIILAGQYDCKTSPTRHRNAQKINTRPHSTTPLGRVVHKGYSLRYLVAHNCTTSGFHLVFLFRGLSGRTTYSKLSVLICFTVPSIFTVSIWNEFAYWSNDALL